ncbi:MAG: VOC family protein [Verrucomicrobiota bacterium]|jgi:uncharacterized glyoxalase superfamily protein PhnB
MIKNRSAAPGPVVPTLVYDDVGEAIKWLRETFGFKERFRYGSEDHPAGAQIAVGAGSVFLTSPRLGQSPNWNDRAMLRAPRSNEFTHTVCVHVDNVDDLYQRIRRCNARIFSAPETHPFGERQFTVEDLGGHRWTFTQSVADVLPEDWGGRSAKNLP